MNTTDLFGLFFLVSCLSSVSPGGVSISAFLNIYFYKNSIILFMCLIIISDLEREYFSRFELVRHRQWANGFTYERLTSVLR